MTDPTTVKRANALSTPKTTGGGYWTIGDNQFLVRSFRQLGTTDGNQLLLTARSGLSASIANQLPSFVPNSNWNWESINVGQSVLLAGCDVQNPTEYLWWIAILNTPTKWYLRWSDGQGNMRSPVPHSPTHPGSGLVLPGYNSIPNNQTVEIKYPTEERHSESGNFKRMDVEIHNPKNDVRGWTKHHIMWRLTLGW